MEVDDPIIKYCSNCGTVMAQKAKTCTNCGQGGQ